ncbi:MAG: hypothetical protein V3R78_10050 [Thermodesulfobacteriota bacterium]
MNREYIIWGKAPKAEHEQPLYTKALTMAEAIRIKGIIETKLKATECRIQMLNLNTPPDFTETLSLL